MVFATQWCVAFDTFCNDRSRGNSCFCHGFISCICRFCNDQSRGNIIYCHLFMCCIRHFLQCSTTSPLVLLPRPSLLFCNIRFSCNSLYCYDKMLWQHVFFFATFIFGGKSIYCHTKIWWQLHILPPQVFVAIVRVLSQN